MNEVIGDTTLAELSAQIEAALAALANLETVIKEAREVSA